MATIDLGRVIPHTHPAFTGTTVTDRDILQWSVTAGLPPRILTAIIQGRIKITDLILSRLTRVFDENITTALVEDYDPLRGMEFMTAPTVRHRTFHHYYPATMLSSGDLIRCDDDRWLLLSSVERMTHSVKIYSGGVPVTRLSDSDEVIAAVLNHDRDNDDLHRDRDLVVSEDQRSRELFTGSGLSWERESMASYIMDKLIEVRDNK